MGDRLRLMTQRHADSFRGSATTLEVKLRRVPQADEPDGTPLSAYLFRRLDDRGETLELQRYDSYSCKLRAMLEARFPERLQRTTVPNELATPNWRFKSQTRDADEVNLTLSSVALCLKSYRLYSCRISINISYNTYPHIVGFPLKRHR